ncbi:carbon-nitrogen hydrolase family protein [Corynebacterium sp. zg-331]|uniref:carbon-nitrogen hydrolase family protein n=1 Tax=unclassified Corynebacterium TaxID=2624378 RepID=UPI00128B00C9|nr:MULTISPECIES: carbon-nitrogen hydrolase family protein [unclassified Corynebacterium]MBC3185784.1 carbon-nitrogen hydrolase family protein [Corynebacterium sp. zg-331]MPV52277.1 amidohydrolase [Corynebacterium sp. zg331]
MRIALAQIHATGNPEENLRTVEAYSRRAADRGARMVVFPEATSQAFGTGRLDTRAQDYHGAFAAGIRELARELGLAIVAGMFRPADRLDDGTRRVWNTALIADGGPPRGYDKIHTYDAFDTKESRTVQPGTAPVLFAVDGVSVGVAICFDLRFPSLFQELARRGAQLIVVPTSWADGPGKLRQWRTLTAARALDTGAFIAGAGMARPGGAGAAGRASGPTGIGHSTLVNPWGQRLAEAGYGEELVVADLDPGLVAQARRDLPIL